MKKLTTLLAIVIIAVACKTDPKQDVSKSTETKKEKFPETLGNVFRKHGGIDNWRASRTLSFNKGEEAHTVDLWSRKTVVNSPKYSMGFDGTNVWLSEKEPGAYRGDPSFYYNLFFYFYAMPFVLADDGIVYSEANPITFEGVSYPGIKISYEANVGTSPDDNYILYYNPTNFQMEWLAYTVTFRSKKPSDKFSLIRYGEWEVVDGLRLPKKIAWYKKDESGQPTEPARDPMEFTLALVKKEALPDSFYAKPTE